MIHPPHQHNNDRDGKSDGPENPESLGDVEARWSRCGIEVKKLTTKDGLRDVSRMYS